MLIVHVHYSALTREYVQLYIMLRSLLLCTSCFPYITVDMVYISNISPQISISEICRRKVSCLKSGQRGSRLDDTVLFYHFQNAMILQIMKQVLILQELDI